MTSFSMTYILIRMNLRTTSNLIKRFVFVFSGVTWVSAARGVGQTRRPLI